MSLSDAIQIVHSSPDNLQVYFPPRYPGGIVFLVLGVIAVALATKLHDRKFNLVLFGVMGLAFLFTALDFCTYHAKLTFSSSEQTVAFEEKTFYYKTKKSFPLKSLQEAVVKAGRSQNRQLVLLVASGPEIPLGDGYNSRANQFEAAHAINSFIARNTQR